MPNFEVKYERSIREEEKGPFWRIDFMNINVMIVVETYCNNYASRTLRRKCGERKKTQEELPDDENYSCGIVTNDRW